MTENTNKYIQIILLEQNESRKVAQGYFDIFFPQDRQII